MDSIIASIREQLELNADAEAKAASMRFFKEDVRFYGMKAAVANKIGSGQVTQLKKAGVDKATIFAICEELWQSGFQEEAMIACIFSESQVKNYSPDDFVVFERWLFNYVSNWATCDTLCNHTVGDLLMMYPELADNLLDWTNSENRWVKRAAAVSLIVPARKGMFLPLIFKIADALLTDSDDMVQKGYGWMLKAAAESDEQAVFNYVMANKANMPRTSLRYAIEKMPPELKQQAMAKEEADLGTGRL
jgi:3-methyladenine DNA glycosylase AlkD